MSDIFGNSNLFTATETYNWSITQFESLAEFCQSTGTKSVTCKVCDGAMLWFSYQYINQIKATFENKGISFIPYLYSYGNKFNALNYEINIIKQLLASCGACCVDMEVEWNGQLQWAQTFAQQLKAHQGVLSVTTWADPSLQNWTPLLALLKPVVDVWLPQCYTSYLTAHVNNEYYGYNVLPIVSLNDANVVSNATMLKRAYGRVSVWYDTLARQQVSLYQSIIGGESVNYKQKQWNDVWAMNSIQAPQTTGIAQYLYSLFEQNKIAATYPTTHEITTCDWNGHSINVQYFASGLHAEWNNEDATCKVYDAKGEEISA